MARREFHQRSLRGRALLVLSVPLLLVLGGCAERPHAEEQPASLPSAPRWERGALVLVEPRAGELFEGRVLGPGADGEQLAVQRLPSGARLEVRRSAVSALDGPREPVTAGVAWCRAEEGRYQPCVVQRVSGELAWLDDGAAAPRSLPLSAVRAPSALSRLHLERWAEERAVFTRFDQGVRAAGRPQRPEGYKPLPHTRVLAPRDGAYQLALVTQLRKGLARVRFLDDSGLAERTPNELSPEPPVAVPLVVGSFALRRPRSVALRWEPVRVEALLEEGARVVDRQGKHAVVPLRDVAPLGG